MFDFSESFIQCNTDRWCEHMTGGINVYLFGCVGLCHVLELSKVHVLLHERTVRSSGTKAPRLNMRDKVFKNWQSKTCGRQSLKTLKTFYLVHSWILCPICRSSVMGTLDIVCVWRLSTVLNLEFINLYLTLIRSQNLSQIYNTLVSSM